MTTTIFMLIFCSHVGGLTDCNPADPTIFYSEDACKQEMLMRHLDKYKGPDMEAFCAKKEVPAWERVQ